MANWTVVVWAAVTPDLVPAIEADLREVKLAAAALSDRAEIALHVVPTPDSMAAITADREASTQQTDGIESGFLSPAADGDGLRAALDQTGWRGPGKRMLVMWGHGANGLRGGDEIKKLAVPAAKVVVQAFAGPDAPPDPDIVGYDACRMASAPTVLTLARGLRNAVFIGSMIPEPASGWPYSELLQILAANSDAEAAAAAIVQSYAASVDVSDWCLLALKLSQIGGRNGALSSALKALKTSPAPDYADFCAAASGADTLDDTNLVDLGALMRRLTDRSAGQAGTDELREAALAVRTAIRTATIARRASGNLAGRDGLSVQVELPALLPVPETPPATGRRVAAKKARTTARPEPKFTDYLEPATFSR